MDFAGLPPEINSGRMYVGAGAAPLLMAATAWDTLASELHSAAMAYRSVVSGLTAGPWSGPTSMLMAAAAAPSVAWMSATAAQCEHAGMQARAAAAAYETAFAATVPPPAIAANRAQLMSLIASNVLGQNTPAIAATEAHYDQMWTQDAAAMYGYAGSSAAATQVTPFTQPTQTTNPGGNAAQAATAAHAAGTGAHAIVAPSMSAVPQALQGLTSPLQAAPAQAGLAGLLATSPISYLSLLSLVTASISPYTASIGTVNLATRLASQQRSERTSELVEKIAVATGAEEGEPSGDADTPSSGTTLVGSTPSDPGVRGSGVAVAAGMGRAASVGSMSVPQSWLAAAPPPPIRTVTQVQPAAASLSTTPTIAAGPEILLGEMAVASLAGRVMTVSGGRGKPTYTITVTQNPPETR